AVAVHLVRQSNFLQDPAGESLRQLLAVDADLKDGELVAAKPADDITRTQAILETVGNALEKAVADEMSELVVGFLEVVEVEPQQRKALAWVVGLELLLQLLAEMETVGDLGQRVMARQPFDLLVRLALRGDVLLHVDPSATGEEL